MLIRTFIIFGHRLKCKGPLELERRASCIYPVDVQDGESKEMGGIIYDAALKVGITKEVLNEGRLCKEYPGEYTDTPRPDNKVEEITI